MHLFIRRYLQIATKKSRSSFMGISYYTIYCDTESWLLSLPHICIVYKMCFINIFVLQFIAATTYDFVAPVDRNSNSSLALQRRRNPRRPQDFRSGVSTAWKTLTAVRTTILLLYYCHEATLVYLESRF